jgi:hypothetical protein
MSGNISPIFSRAGDIQGGVVLTAAANDYNGQNVNNAVVFSADPMNGGYIQRLRFKALGTNVATVCRIYVNNGQGHLAPYISAVSSAPTGSASNSGGTLQSGSYYAKIVAVDQYGAMTAPSSESSAVSVTGPTGSISWSWSAVSNAASYMIFVGNVSGGQISYFTSTTNSFTQVAPVGIAKSINGATANNFLYGEFSLPSTSASSSASTIEIDYPLNFALPPAYSILVGLGTAVSAGWSVTAIGGKY